MLPISPFDSGRTEPRVTSGGVCQRRLRHDFSNIHASIISLESKFANASYGYAADSTSLQNYRTIHMNVFAWRATHSCSPKFFRAQANLKLVSNQSESDRSETQLKIWMVLLVTEVSQAILSQI